MSDDDDIFSRWSKRKRGVAKEEALEAAPEPDVASKSDSTEAETSEREPETEAEEIALLEKLGLPSPESLGHGDDFTVFMKAGVPEFLRNRALRVLWRSNPVLANLDGLNDYDQDFRSPEMTRKVLATAYKVGRGFLTEKKEPEIMQDNDTEDTEISDMDTEMEAELTVAEQPAAEAEDARSAEREDTDENPENLFNPKRMRFET